jgi:hypothetical protein
VLFQPDNRAINRTSRLFLRYVSCALPQNRVASKLHGFGALRFIELAYVGFPLPKIHQHSEA